MSDQAGNTQASVPMGTDVYVALFSEEAARMLSYGIFACEECGDEWPDELPPLWAAGDMWPVCRCCGQTGTVKLKYKLHEHAEIWMGAADSSFVPAT